MLPSGMKNDIIVYTSCKSIFTYGANQAVYLFVSVAEVTSFAGDFVAW